MARLRIEVIYALPDTQQLVLVEIDEGGSAIDAVRASGLCESHPSLVRGRLRLGIFGVEVRHDALVADGDRVEIYRPLAVDPKEARRAKARAGSARPRKPSV